MGFTDWHTSWQNAVILELATSGDHFVTGKQTSHLLVSDWSSIYENGHFDCKEVFGAAAALPL